MQGFVWKIKPLWSETRVLVTIYIRKKVVWESLNSLFALFSHGRGLWKCFLLLFPCKMTFRLMVFDRKILGSASTGPGTKFALWHIMGVLALYNEHSAAPGGCRKTCCNYSVQMNLTAFVGSWDKVVMHFWEQSLCEGLQCVPSMRL